MFRLLWIFLYIILPPFRPKCRIVVLEKTLYSPRENPRYTLAACAAVVLSSGIKSLLKNNNAALRSEQRQYLLSLGIFSINTSVVQKTHGRGQRIKYKSNIARLNCIAEIKISFQLRTSVRKCLFSCLNAIIQSMLRKTSINLDYLKDQLMVIYQRNKFTARIKTTDQHVFIYQVGEHNH